MFWCSRKAITMARNSIGTVERNQMMKVFPTAFQKRSSVTRNWYCASPTKEMSPIPSQSVKDSTIENRIGNSPKIANRR
jgi:hypothetical protein